MLKQQPGSLWYRSDPHTAIRELPGIGSKLGKRIVEDLGDGDPHAALVAIERNPYTLTDVEGIGFRKADKIALQTFDIGPDDVRRNEAGNRFILKEKGVLNEREFFAERVKIELREPTYKTLGVDVEDGLYWLPEELEAEKGLERWARGLSRAGRDGDTAIAFLTDSQRAICERLGLDDVQITAVQGALAEPVLVLTGGAGCGKTHVVAALSLCQRASGRTVRGMAFAGKAADRMREAFDQYGVLAEATTIHKALGFMKKGFTVEELAEDLIVIDESSMLPNWLLWAVVKRLKPGATLILVGDPNQLPPIGYGTPFVDLIAHGIPRAHLSRNYRQADQQGILHMAEGILHRQRPSPAECVEMHLGVEQANLDALFDQLIRTHGGTDYEAWQVITYQNENAERYNLRAQAIINPDGTPLFEYPLWKLGKDPRGWPLYHAEVRQGDKVIVVKNSSTLGIFNGQTGRVVGRVTKPKLVQRRDPTTGRWEIEPGEVMPHLLVEITGLDVAVPEDEVEKHLQLGYVITVHKAQGSDWNRVIVMQPGKVRDDTARKFFYTASTRAKNHLVIVSTLRVVAWWTNAAADAPDEPSSLTRRLARPAPEPECSWCDGSGEPCACNGGEGALDWAALASQSGEMDSYHLGPDMLPESPPALALSLHVPADTHLAAAVVTAQGNVVTHWRTLRQSGVAETLTAAQPPADLDRVRAEFRALDLGVA
ncbi:AAA family ATPase [uncultured Deinococcus sp.]|uniref:AAA family ATPase n=1 Tax=uncultured Deinococcus sp. TaxID=158789 RepID=UPI0025CC3F0E|nr:AAA family ATPase [uncultured Deinococcus sp.]